MSMILFSFLLSFYFIFSLGKWQTTVTIEIENGEIKGKISYTHLYRKFYAFYEIPYAVPPVGPKRFQPPEPAPKWNSVLDATKGSKICHQINNPHLPNETEDCLYLNVYTPQLPETTKNTPKSSLPVMVYFYGGAFATGDALYSTYGPDYFMHHDVIIVTVNYRLGPFGFLSTEDKILPGNNGLKDQFLALKWVQTNIPAFGGNPQKVTIFGQSAGAAAVAYHLINPKTKGLYRAAIMESATALCPFGFQRNAKKNAYKTAQYINNSISDKMNSQDLLNFLMTVSAEEIRNAADNLSVDTIKNIQINQGFFYAPVLEIESEEAVLTEKMFGVLNSGKSNPVPIIIGVNSEEAIGPTTNGNVMRAIMSFYDTNTSYFVPNDMNVEEESTKREAGNKIRQIYVGDGKMQDDLGASIRFMSDTAFDRPVIMHATLQSQYSDVYFYIFSFDGKMFNNTVKVDGADTVGHNEELAYLWRVNTSLINNYNLSQFDQRDFDTRDRLLTLWTNFAKYLDPTPRAEDILQNIKWTKFNENRAYLDINDNLTIKYDPKNEMFEGWKQVYDEFGDGDYDTY